MTEAKAKDPLLTFRAYLVSTGILTEEIDQQLNKKIAEEINEATDYAEKAPYAQPEDTLKYVYGN